MLASDLNPGDQIPVQTFRGVQLYTVVGVQSLSAEGVEVFAVRAKREKTKRLLIYQADEQLLAHKGATP